MFTNSLGSFTVRSSLVVGALWLVVAGPAAAQQPRKPLRIPPDAKGYQQVQIIQEYYRQQHSKPSSTMMQQTNRQTSSRSTTTPSKRLQVSSRPRVYISPVVHAPVRATVPVQTSAQVPAQNAGGNASQVSYSGPVVSTIVPTPCWGR